MALASPVPTQERGITTMHEGRARLSFAERADILGLSLDDLISQDRQNVLAKYRQNVNLVKAALAAGEDLTSGLLGTVSGLLGKRAGSAATIKLTDVVSGNVDELYYGPLNMGTPAQTIQFDFDTGSADLWTPIQNSDAYNDGTHFNTAASSTYKNTTQPFHDEYGSGSVDGSLGIETVRFGGLTSTSQYFGAATHVSSSFNNNPATGLCGLAYKSIASTRQNPLHVNLQAQGQLAAAKFGFRLTRGTSTGAELTMGGIASDYASASFKTTPVTSKTYWEVGTNGMSVKNTVTGSSFPAAIDTGTTLVYIPTSAASAFYAAIPNSKSNGDGSYDYPCSFTGPVGISFPNAGNLNFNIADLNLGKTSSTMCRGAVQGMDVQDANGNNFAIVGDVFIKSYYTVFDFSANTVGFAAA
ncbi:aspartic protease [Dioszegia hungarica]|uniref:Aspartic protease n=1 Tax=Dioszegia hungarica TaxID=4972 RepID=A0AA38H3A9_9TREE|nr:aspartic protease [Dioszegia hungarica]KAI9633340.1 aspartic protease [Dioszegia hungarica]